MVIAKKWAEVQCACVPSRKLRIHFCALEDSSTQTNLTSCEDTASEGRDCSAGASVHAAGARSLCMETLKFGQLPNSCEPLEKECRSESECCVTTKKVKSCWLCHSG